MLISRKCQICQPATSEMSAQTEDCYQGYKELKAEMNVMKGAHAAELKRFGDYIARLEHKLKMRDELISTLRHELHRKQEPFMQGFEEIWSNEKRKHQHSPENSSSPSSKRVKSVVVKRLF